MTIFLLVSVLIPLAGCKALAVTETGNTAAEQTKPVENTEEIEEENMAETTEADTESSGQAAEITEQEKIIAGFNKLFEENAMPDELIKYIDDNLSNTMPSTMTVLLDKLEHVQKAYIEIATQYLFEGDGQQKLINAFENEDEFTKDNIDKITDENLKSDILKILDGGYRFINLEGCYYPIIDFEYLKKYSGYIDKEYSDYINIRAEESNEVYARDAGLMISWDELAARMINAEKYISAYKNETHRRIETGNLMLLYFASYLYGQNNTPTRDWTTNTVFEEVIQSYNKTISDNIESEAAKIIKNYLEELKNTNYTFTDEIYDIIAGYINELIKIYELDSPYMISEQMKYLNFPSANSVNGYIQLTDGKYTEEINKQDGFKTELSITLSDFIATGDLDANGINDGAAVLIEKIGETDTFYYLHAIYNGGFYIYSIANAFLGDIMVKVGDIKIEDGKIYVDMSAYKESDPKCCPVEKVTKIFVLKDSYLEEVEQAGS